jgi:hypothetical protein
VDNNIVLNDLVQHFDKQEGQGQTNTNESFADDSYNLFIFNLRSLSVLKAILIDFKESSGLSSNVEKSFIMRIVDLSGEITQDILDLGFSFTDRIKLLGFTLQNYGDIVAVNFEEIIIKYYVERHFKGWGVLIPRGAVSGIMGFELSIQQYNQLVNCFRIACRKYHKDTEQTTTVRYFMTSFKKGSRRFRNVLTNQLKTVTLPDGSGLRYFLRCIELEPPSVPRMTSMVSKWNIGILNTSVRVFSLKFYNNILGINSRVTHFNPGVDAGCTFCVLGKILPAPKETMSHLFFDCPTTERVEFTVPKKYYFRHANVFFIKPI